MKKYLFSYVLDDGKPKTVHIDGKDMFDAIVKFERFVKAILQKFNMPFNDMTISMMAVVPKSTRGRKKS